MTSTSYHHRSSRGPADANIRHSVPGTAPAIRPVRSHHLPRESKKQKPTPFDPDDLSRRLQIVLAEEKAYADKKRRSRANIDRSSTQPQRVDSRKGREVPLEITAYQATASKSAQATAARRSVLSSKRRSGDPTAMEADLPQPPEKDELPSYHHVPTVAATQFARTTAHEPTSDKSLVHKLSRKAMKYHMEGPNAQAEPKEGGAPDEQARALHKARGEREKTYGRNQFQHPAAILEAPGDVDDRQNREAAYRQTFETQFRNRQSSAEEGDETANPRVSTSSARGHQRGGPRDSSDFPVGMYPVLSQDSSDLQDGPVRIDDHRVDWTQSDEKTSAPLSPTLRKADSKWTLKGRLGFHRTSKTEKEMLAAEERATSPGLRSQRSSFFARFKR